MTTSLPPVGTTALLEQLADYVPDDFIATLFPRDFTGGRRHDLSAAQLWRVHLLALLTPTHSLAEAPHTRHRIARIVAMGGCIGPLGPFRRAGNTTAFAEFNFYMDPEAAAYVIQSGIPMVLLPMDATHQLVLSNFRKSRAATRWPCSLGSKLIQMLSAAENLDRAKFELDGAAVHDLHVMVYLVRPDLYRGRLMGVTVNTDKCSEEHGRLAIDDRSQNRLCIPGQIGQRSDLIRTACRSNPDTVPTQIGQRSGEYPDSFWAPSERCPK